MRKNRNRGSGAHRTGPGKLSGLLTGLLTGLVASGGVARAEDGGLPRMRADQPVHCTQEEGLLVRIQCDDTTKVCLRSGTSETGPDGKARRLMERLAPCDGSPKTIAELTAEGYTFQAAIADAPPGWSRDARGRVFQVTFDLSRRFYLGAGYAGMLEPGEGARIDRPVFDFGLAVDRHRSSRNVRYRMRLGEGRIALNPFGYDISSFQVDRLWVNEDPFLRLTTFVGPPRRFDVDLQPGWGLSLMQFRYDPVLAPGVSEIRFGEMRLGLDLWQSGDLSGHVRLQAGPALELLSWETLGEKELGFSWVAALDGRFTLDRRGLTHLEFTMRGERPTFFNDGRPELERTGSGLRASGQVMLERILIAVNDQPVSIYVRGEGVWRDDLPGEAGLTHLIGVAGVRYSFWAPALETP